MCFMNTSCAVCVCSYSPSLLFQAQIGFDHLLSAGLSLTTLRWLIVCHSRHSDRLGSVLADFSVIVVIQIDHTQLLHPCSSVSRPWPMDQKTHPTGRKAGGGIFVITICFNEWHTHYQTLWRCRACSQCSNITMDWLACIARLSYDQCPREPGLQPSAPLAFSTLCCTEAWYRAATHCPISLRRWVGFLSHNLVLSTYFCRFH